MEILCLTCFRLVFSKTGYYQDKQTDYRPTINNQELNRSQENISEAVAGVCEHVLYREAAGLGHFLNLP